MFTTPLCLLAEFALLVAPLIVVTCHRNYNEDNEELVGKWRSQCKRLIRVCMLVFFSATR